MVSEVSQSSTDSLRRMALLCKSLAPRVIVADEGQRAASLFLNIFQRRMCPHCVDDRIDAALLTDESLVLGVVESKVA